MTETRKRLLIGFCSVSALVVSGCAGSSSTQRFSMSFMPPAPRNAVAAAVSDVPQVIQPVSVSQSPLYITSAPIQVPPKPTQTDMRVRRAEERFSAGRRAYQNGDFVTARTEFDQAIDLLLTVSE